MGPSRSAGRAPIQSLAEIPFDRRDPLDLLALREERAAPDPDYTGFGYARVDQIWLDDESGSSISVRDPLLLALHSCDLGAPLPDDVLLEFFVDDVAPDYSVTALLSAFVAARLPELRGDEGAIVLAMCNPHRAALAHPAAAGPVPVHYPLGDVESWLEPPGFTFRLRAPAWRVAGGD